MTQIPVKQAISQRLLALAKQDRSIVVLVSDSRGSASMTEFAEALPEQFVDVGIAEQNLVGMAAGLAAGGKKPFVASYASFLSLRSIEQIKVDVAYSQMNVKLIGVSGGVSYGPLGMTHHALQDVAVMRAIPGIAVVMPADRYESIAMVESLVQHTGPVYVRVGRNPVPDVYSCVPPFQLGQAVQLREGSDVTLLATGDMVKTAVDSASLLAQQDISCRVLNVHTLKPLDRDAVTAAAAETNCLVTLEEHSVHGGLGSAVAEVVVQHRPVPMEILGLPDEPVVTGTSEEVFRHYRLDPQGVAGQTLALVRRLRRR